MKKRSIAFFLCLFFLCIGIVQAKEDPFALDWKNDDKATTFEQVGIIDANLIYNDDYVNFRIDMNPYNQKISTILRRYDHDGNLVKEKELVHKLVKNIVTDGEYIYAVTFDIGSMYGGYYAETFGIDPAQYGVSSYDDYEIGLSIVKFNKNFAIEEEFNFKESDLEYLINDGDIMKMLMIQLLGRAFGYSTMTIDNDNIYFLQYGMGILVIDKDLKELSTYKIDYNPQSNKIKNYFEQIYDTSVLAEKIEEGIISIDKNESYYAFTSISDMPDLAYLMSMRDEPVGYPQSMPASNSVKMTEQELIRKGYIGLTDSEGNVLWKKELKNNAFAINVKLINNYVVAIAVDDYGTEIVVYDLEGNIVQEIYNEMAFYTHLVPNETGFMVSKNTIDASTCMSKRANFLNGDGYSSDCAMYTTTEVYQLEFDINTNVTGEGEIIAATESFVGKEQSFEVKPKFGWKVDKVVVKDEYGNELDVNDNKFIMPTSNVTIEVTFTKIIEAIIENPNTASISITGLVLFACALGYITYKNYKKVKFLK